MIANPDVTIADHGTVWLFTTHTQAARDFVIEHVDIPEYMRLGRDTFAADHRPARDLLDGLIAEGLSIAPHGG